MRPRAPSAPSVLSSTDRPVSDLAPGTLARVTTVDVVARQRMRLAELGIRTGTQLTVLTRTAGGGRLLATGTGRVAVDRATAGALRAEPV